MNNVIENQKINNMCLILISIIFFGYLGHSNMNLLYKIPAVILMFIGLLKILTSIRNRTLNNYGNLFKYSLWYGLFIIFNCASLRWTIGKEETIELLKSIIITFFYVLGIMMYTTNYIRLKNVLKVFLYACVYMCIRLIIRDYKFIGTDFFGESVGLYFNRIATILAYAMILAFYLYKIDKKKKYLIILPFFYIVIFLTGSRKGILMPISFIGLFMFLNMLGNIRKIIKTIFIFIVILFTIFMIIKSKATLANRFLDLFNSIIYKEETTDGSINERKYFRDTAIKLFETNPAIGIGANGFKAYLTDIKYKHITYSHCNFTELLCDLGYVGFTLYYCMYLWILKNSLKHFKSNNYKKILSISFIIIEFIFEYGIVSYYMFEFQIMIALIFFMSEFSNEKENDSIIT